MAGADALLRAFEGLSPTTGLLVAGLGLVYLAVGKWVFRVLVAGIGMAAGLEVGRTLGGHFEIEGPWLPLLVAAVAAAAAWPAWQGLVFLIGGAALGFGVAEAVRGVTGHGQYYLFALIGGFLGGGLLAVFLQRGAAVVLTALVGAWLTLTGLFAFGHDEVPLVAAAAESPIAGLVLLGVLAAIGVAVQMMLPSAEERRRRALDAAFETSKSDEEAERRRRYAQYLGR